MSDITALAKTLRLAAESEIAHRAESDTSDLWQDEASPENILALVEALENAQAINAAAEKLVRCKGRYHSEQNYRALAALFGVNTPDLPPLDGESQPVTVKLPSGTGWASDPYNHGRNDGISECAKELRAAGINVEAE